MPESRDSLKTFFDKIKVFEDMYGELGKNYESVKADDPESLKKFKDEINRINREAEESKR